MKQVLGPIAIIIAVAVALVAKATFYVVPEGRQAIITQFGRPVGEPITKPGLHWKTPFVHEIRYVDKRILSWDGDPNQITTKDKKFIGVDTTARWKIVDPLKFIQTVQNERGARTRLDAILDSKTREVISNYNLVEVVRNSNMILEDIERIKAAGKEIGEDEVIGEVENVDVGREKLSEIISQKADVESEALGIKIIDVQLKRVSYEKSVENKVYERMISERRRIAEKIRSIGRGEKAKIQGRLSRDLQKIESEAYRTAQSIKGKAEAQATLIYAKAMAKGPEFYEFLRSMEAYDKALSGKTKFILSSESEFLHYLKDIDK